MRNKCCLGFFFVLEVPRFQRVLILFSGSLQSRDLNRKKHSYGKLNPGILHISKQNGIELKEQKKLNLLLATLFLFCVSMGRE